MTNWPMDVIGDILSRLLVKSLLRFRCVSNPWCALIDGPHFIKLHLNRSIETKNHHNLLLRRDDDLYSIAFDSLDRAVNLDHPKKSTYVGTRVVGSCHGLVYLCNATEDRIAIWNPSTRKCRKIPMADSQLERIPPPWQYLTYGFGYDSVSDDYKVVRIHENHGKLGGRVYSMKSNSWLVDDEFVRDPVKFSNQSTTFGQEFNNFSPRSNKGKDPSTSIVDIEAEVRDIE